MIEERKGGREGSRGGRGRGIDEISILLIFYLLVPSPTNWSKGKFLGSGAFGQVCAYICTRTK